MSPAKRARPTLRPRFLALLLAVVFESARGEIRVVGCDLLGPAFTQGLLEAGLRHRCEVRVAFDGSLPGSSRLEAGTADLGFLLSASDAKESVGVLESRPLAYFAVAVVVAAETPLARITLGQLAEAFGPREGAPRLRWSDLMVADHAGGGAIELHAPAPDSGLTHDLFRRVVLGGRSLRDTVHQQNDSVVLGRAVAASPKALAFMAVPPANAVGLTIVPVATDARSPAFAPDPVELHAGRYPLRLTLRLVFRREARAQLASMLGYLASDDAAERLRLGGWIPLPREVREEAAREWVADANRRP
jgi:hypothetical protein